MRAEARQAEALKDRALRLERGEGGVGAAALDHVADRQLLAELAVDALRVDAERLGGRRLLERRPALLEAELDPGVGDQLLLYTLADDVLRFGEVRQTQHAHVRIGDRVGGNDVAVGARFRERPVQLEADLGLGEVAHLQHLVRELVERVAAELRRAAGVRSAAPDRHRDRADAAGGERQAVAVGARAFAGEHRVVLGAEPGEHRPRAGRADLLVAVDEHRERAVVAEVHGLQHRHGVDDQRDALLVVRDAKAVGALAVDAERLLGEHALQVHRVHVRDEQDLLLARALEAGEHHAADLLGRVEHPVAVGAGLDELDRAAERFQAIGDQARDPVQAFAVAAAGLDRHQLLHGLDHRRLFLLGK